MRIAALVLNWKRPDETIRCLSSIHAFAKGVEALVVDNASGDGSIERIRAAHPWVTILPNDTNAGYAGGNDAGFAELLARTVDRPDAILVLNNDVELLPGCIEALEAAVARDPGRGLFAPVSLSREDPEILDFHRARIDLPNMAVHALGRGERLDPSEDTESDYAPGSAFLVRTPVIEDLGGFHEDFFLVWEDVDLALHAAKRGYGRALIVADARVLHEGSVSFAEGAAGPRYRYFYVRNSYLLARRHLSGFQLWRTQRLLDRRYKGWIAKTADPNLRAAIALAVEHAHANRFGPIPPELS
jgi:GT2 family glycosyltransferase